MLTFRWPPIVAAVVLTLLNAGRPVVVDDTAYLLRARHLAAHPTEPYGGTLFWYASPEPAMDVLVPPVVPYWLALGINIFGERVFWLKMWMFPFAWLLMFSFAQLLRTYAPGTDIFALMLFTVTVIPFFTLMLDVPALAFGVAAVAVLTRTSAGVKSALLAGILTALAMQTKYSMLALPAVLMWVGVINRRLTLAMLSVSVGLLLFFGWEWLVEQVHGQSHFFKQTRIATGGGGTETSGVVGRLTGMIGQRSGLMVPFIMQWGGFGAGLAIWLCACLGRSRWPARIFVGLLFPLLAAIVLTPARSTLLTSAWAGTYSVVDLPSTVFFALGLAHIFLLMTGVLINVVNRSGARDWVFLVGWLCIEVGGAFLLSPFPAARRLLGVEVVAVLLSARVVQAFLSPSGGREPPVVCTVGKFTDNPTGGLRPPLGKWLLLAVLMPSILIASIDAWDSWPEQVLAERAAEVISTSCLREPGASTVWYRGHWGFQWYCEQAGMRPVIVNQSTLAAGDWLVFPVTPDPAGFYRPYHGGLDIVPDPAFLEPIVDLVWIDAIAGQTIPNLHGGAVPLTGRDYPRLHVRVYRVRADWRPTTN